MKFMKGDTDSCSMCPSRVFHVMSSLLSNGHIHSTTGLLEEATTYGPLASLYKIT